MAGSPQKKFNPRPGVIAPEAYNAFVETFRHVDATAGGRLGEGSALAGSPSDLLVTVKNMTGAEQARGAIVCISDILFDPLTVTRDQQYFRSNFAFKVAKPDTDLIERVACVLMEPVADQKFGRAAIVGPVAVKVNVTASGHNYATLIDDETTKLASSVTGFPILWKQSGLGDKLAVILLGQKNQDVGVVLSSSSSLGSGIYNANLATLPTSPLTTSTALTDARCGGASTLACYVFNNHEIGSGAGHDLATGKVYPGAKYIGTATDGKPVYLIHVIPTNCT